MTLFTRSLWPASVRSPYRRLIVAMIVSPLLLAALLSLGAFLIAGMSEPTRERVMAVTIDSALALTMMMLVFTAICGLLGVLLLWAAAQRGLLIWAATGAILGATAGVAIGLMTDMGPNKVLLIGLAIIGWVEFLLIRKFAGIRPDD